jgi:hypothetical protein
MCYPSLAPNLIMFVIYLVSRYVPIQTAELELGYPYRQPLDKEERS